MSDQVTESKESAESKWDHARFVGKMIWATKNHPLPSTGFPTEVDLTGKIGQICDDLLAKTMSDPRKRERGKVAKVDIEGKIRIAQEENIGEETHLNNISVTYVKKRLMNPQYSQYEYIAFDMHTHGVLDVPPSPQDFSLLLTPTEEGGGQAIVVITPSSRFLIMKTLDTPDLTVEEADKFAQKELNELQNYYEHIKSFSTNNDLYRKATTQKNMQFVLDTCRDYKLKLYTSTGDNIYRQAG